MKTSVVLLLAVCLGLVPTGCGTKGASTGAAPGGSEPTGSTSTTETQSRSPAVLSGDGRYFGYVKTAAAEPPTIDFDVAQAFSGEAANRAAAEDGVVPEGEPVPNDHYERNPDERVRVLRVAPDARVTAAPPASFLMKFTSREARARCEAANRESVACTQIPLSLAVFFDAFKQKDARFGVPVWVTIRDGVAVRIEEQYFP